MTEATVARLCRCIYECPDDQLNSTCVLTEKGKCFRKLQYSLEEDRVIETAGCLGSTELYVDQCNKNAHPEFNMQTDYKCCDDADLCNDNLELKLPEITRPDDLIDGSTLLVLIVTISVAFTICIFLVVLCCIRFKRQERKRKDQIDEEYNESLGLPNQKGPPRLTDLIKGHTTGGSSGAGMPLLVQRTIARQIELVSELGRGRYGKVMLGKWREEKVAVKLFNTIDEDSWFRETEIYQTVLLRHENILCFIASDINGNGSWTQLYLITDYHENGSLYDYLNSNELTISEAVTLAHTAACGLAHLHIEIIGTHGKPSSHTVQDVNGKPAIAHRDVKSKNILVKKDKTCCIADMGLAVKYNSSIGQIDYGKCEGSVRQGTKRYMSPELLNGSMIRTSFDAFKASDVYSFSLVMWEILNCIQIKGNTCGYLLPYYNVVGNDPDYDEMRDVVDIKQIRPETRQNCFNHPALYRYIETMQECWAHRPESRLTMLRVRKTLGLLSDELHGRRSSDSKSVDPYTNHFIYSNNSSVNKDMYITAMSQCNQPISQRQTPVVHSGINGQINGPRFEGHVVYHSDESATPLINDDSATNSRSSGSA